ncbi:MAG: hypothetical protein AB4042_07820 [Leptolyngbyaceae cyanobacterium]
MDALGYLSTLDQLIILVYFLITLAVGLYFSRRAAAGMESYFLGDRQIPWWMLGLSGTASNFDMTGTMVVISFFYAIGLQGFWVAMRGAIALPYAVLMVYMGKWLRRSEVLTTAEWMTLRFGNGRAGQVARALSAVSNLVVTLAMLVYFVEGSGKFLSIYLPFSPIVCAILMMLLAVTYTMLSGFFGVIYTDVVQELFLLTVSVWVGYQAFTLPTHDLAIALPDYPNWHRFLPQWQAASMSWLENPLVYQSFGLCIIFWVGRGLLEGIGGYSGGYAPQRFYAAKTVPEASKLGGAWVVLLLFRWSLVIGVVILGLDVARTNPTVAQLLASDPEKTLPIVVGTALPSGVRGLLVTGMVAAAMSTFDSTINAGVSYWVNDLYRPYLNPDADTQMLVRQSYVGTLILAGLAILFSLSVQNINEIWSWITGPLAAGLLAPIVLRWYWWRLNGYGFAIATTVGLVVSIVVQWFIPDFAFYLAFLTTLTSSLVAGWLGSSRTAPTAMETLTAFWLKIKPFGFWEPVRQQVIENTLKEQGEVAMTGETMTGETMIVGWRDRMNLPIALVWQLASIIAVIALLLHQWLMLVLSLSIVIILTLTLYFTWYQPLQSRVEPQG